MVVIGMQNNVLVTSHITLVRVQTINTNSVDSFAWSVKIVLDNSSYCRLNIDKSHPVRHSSDTPLSWRVVPQNCPFEILDEISIETVDWVYYADPKKVSFAKLSPDQARRRMQSRVTTIYTAIKLLKRVFRLPVFHSQWMELENFGSSRRTIS
ncbi:hypothetical protein T265_12312 [Opisthorchis viverrini]|uniref:Uncharacterized protein n=1 Tax=Opisthorchis viverrini TaxID=6198 RepID=A0A074Z4T3_OPIVI|nr:hypothetical protein T265_12312 [Opisthorchis viverrini]KER18315.1 hypothetical protein T265_12312 [Opisthorchis viverrini]